jgi:transcription elongation GreA/GreB family factor
MTAVTKASLRDELLGRLRDDLARLERAHEAALEGATHAEARPENAKDTRALEQSYLARGQSFRVDDLRRAVTEVATMPLTAFTEATPVGLGALVTALEDETERVFFIAPHGGGSALARGAVQVVTPSSPLGRALVGRTAGDVCEIEAGGRTRELEIATVR